MAEVSYFWDGATGDGTNYDDSILMDTVFRAILAGTGNEGVLKGWLNELEPTDAGGLNVDVDTGGAIVYGLFYESDAVETIAMPNNATNWIVVQRSWAAQTARLAVVAALTQTPDVTYDIPIAQVTTAAGVITLLTDSRDFCEFNTGIIDFSVVTDNIVDDAVTTAKMIDQTRWLSRGAGCLEPDGTNPASWVGSSAWPNVYRDMWEFDNAAQTIPPTKQD